MIIVKMVGGSGIGAESLASPPKRGPMQSINMFSTYGKLQLIFFTIPTLKISESVLSLF